MVRVVQLVMGIAGSGKSTYCECLQEHLSSLKRSAVLVNLDPAAEECFYEPQIDIRELVSVRDTTEALRLGPNGGLVRCLDLLVREKLGWLREQMDLAGPGDSEHFVFDCPGQIELYTHIPSFRALVRALRQWGLTVLGSFFIDSVMVLGDANKYLSSVMLATSAMVHLELPWLNVLSKVDLIGAEDQAFYCEVDLEWVRQRIEAEAAVRAGTALGRRVSRLNRAVCGLAESFSMVHFVGLEARNPESLGALLEHVDYLTQYGEDDEPRMADAAEEEETV
ncbi:hypothetical protein BASA81_000770 [Batrachochytrium salamandrivorans]|nr:hypothetical protein BASA81_000770 [Batrachochytrium salamandrivorans]